MRWNNCFSAWIPSCAAQIIVGYFHVMAEVLIFSHGPLCMIRSCLWSVGMYIKCDILCLPSCLLSLFFGFSGAPLPFFLLYFGNFSTILCGKPKNAESGYYYCIFFLLIGGGGGGREGSWFSILYYPSQWVCQNNKGGKPLVYIWNILNYVIYIQLLVQNIEGLMLDSCCLVFCKQQVFVLAKAKVRLSKQQGFTFQEFRDEWKASGDSALS